MCWLPFSSCRVVDFLDGLSFKKLNDNTHKMFGMLFIRRLMCEIGLNHLIIVNFCKISFQIIDSFVSASSFCFIFSHNFVS